MNNGTLDVEVPFLTLSDLLECAAAVAKQLGGDPERLSRHTVQSWITKGAFGSTGEESELRNRLFSALDVVELSVVPDFPCSREEAVQRAKRQRLEVRLMQVGLGVARLQEQRDRIRLFGLGQLPLGLSLQNSPPAMRGLVLSWPSAAPVNHRCPTLRPGIVQLNTEAAPYRVRGGASGLYGCCCV